MAKPRLTDEYEYARANYPEGTIELCIVSGFTVGLVCGPFISVAITQSWDYAFVGTLASMLVGAIVGGVVGGVLAWKEECRRQELFFK